MNERRPVLTFTALDIVEYCVNENFMTYAAYVIYFECLYYSNTTANINTVYIIICMYYNF